MKEKTIKPCPFCGGNAVLFSRSEKPDKFSYDIKCLTSGCYLLDGADWWISYSDVIDMWNLRIQK